MNTSKTDLQVLTALGAADPARAPSCETTFRMTSA
jgi:hypothetical protein